MKNLSHESGWLPLVVQSPTTPFHLCTQDNTEIILVDNNHKLYEKNSLDFHVYLI